jgi:hypothetical protein
MACSAMLGDATDTTIVSAVDPMHIWVTSENQHTQATTLVASADGVHTRDALQI